MSESTKELSDPELRNAVTQHVMEWHVEEFTLPDGGVPFWNWADESGGRCRHVEDWEPAESVDHAIEVIEKMQEKGWETRIGTHSYGLRWMVEMFHTKGNLTRRESASSDSLPECICKCALAAIGSKE
jgi:hypothetical protein